MFALFSSPAWSIVTNTNDDVLQDSSPELPKATQTDEDIIKNNIIKIIDKASNVMTVLDNAKLKFPALVKEYYAAHNYDIIWNYHKFPIFTSFRDKLKDYLSKNNIETGIHYSKTLPEYSVFGKSEISYPVAEMLSKTELSLPIYPELNEEELSWICDCINKFYITQHT